MKRIRETIELCLDVQREESEPLDIVGVQKVCRSGMTKLPSLTDKEVIKTLRKAGFEVMHVKESHHFLLHENGLTTVVPVHAGEAHISRRCTQASAGANREINLKSRSP